MYIPLSVPLCLTSEFPGGSCGSDEHRGASLHAVCYCMADASHRRTGYPNEMTAVVKLPAHLDPGIVPTLGLGVTP
jgi:hypothetical protein